MTSSTRALRALFAGSALAGALALLPAPAALAQQQKPAPAPKSTEQAPEAKSIELTQKQVDGLVAAQPELAKIQGGDPQKPDPKLQEKVEAIAKKAGFANADEMEDAGDSVEAVLGGLDPQSKAYVGPSALIKQQIAEVEADKKMPAKDKAAALKELKEALAAGDPPKPSEGNIALVSKNFDKLSQIQGDQ